MRRIHWCFLVALLFIGSGRSYAEHFLADDPIRVDPDKISIPEPKPHDIARVHDFFMTTFFDPGGSHKIHSQNINTLGEVPDSSWFTNRLGSRSMTLEEIAKGPNTDGPDLKHPWIVTKAKTDGATTGFVIQDGRGDTYYIKLDSPETPELQSSAEVISTKFFYAMGYNVPENYIADVRPDQLKIKDRGEKVPKAGKISQVELQQLLANIPRQKDGTIRVLASLQVKGKPIGGFHFYGTRSDDANDIIPHENRRELRGYRVFASWLNHTDSDSKNTFDVYVNEGTSNYIKHYLLDFGTTLGSAAAGTHQEGSGYEYRVDLPPIIKTAATLGIWDRPWKHIEYPPFPAVGSIDSDHFDPGEWRPDIPNPAFLRMQLDDGFWAAKIVAAFSDEAIRAIVKTAQISDPNAEAYMVRILIERQDKIVQYYFSQLNPISGFAINGTQLEFQNVGEEAKLGTVEQYQYQWFQFNNETSELSPISKAETSRTPRMEIPGNSSPYLMVRINTICEQQPKWSKAVDVYIRNASRPGVVGIERKTN